MGIIISWQYFQNYMEDIIEEPVKSPKCLQALGSDAALTLVENHREVSHFSSTEE